MRGRERERERQREREREREFMPLHHLSRTFRGLFQVHGLAACVCILYRRCGEDLFLNSLSIYIYVCIYIYIYCKLSRLI